MPRPSLPIWGIALAAAVGVGCGSSTPPPGGGPDGGEAGVVSTTTTCDTPDLSGIWTASGPNALPTTAAADSITGNLALWCYP